MAVRVIIERKVPPEKRVAAIVLMTKLRAAASIQPGYISGETLRDIDSDEDFIVISTWHSAADWNAWRASPKRVQLQNEMDELLGSSTVYRMFTYPDKRPVNWPFFWDTILDKTQGHGN